MDLAGTAVGIISLGLQVCQGIVSYSQTWRGYDEEVQNTRNKAEALRMLLKNLRDTIEELQQTRPKVAADLEEKAIKMHSSIEKLRKIVGRFKPAQSEAFPDKVRAQLKKGVYYFQKDGLQDMQNHLDQIQNVLQTSLLIYNWQDTRESRLMQVSIYEEMLCMHSTLKKAISSSDMPPPSLLQIACDSQCKQPPVVLSDSGLMVQTNLGVDSNRPPNQHIWTRSRPKTVTRAYSYHSSVLKFAISVSFSMVRGAGGLSIAPTLQFQSVWGEDSERYRTACVVIGLGNIGDPLIPKLLNAFSEQTLSPYDTFTAGKDGGIKSLMDMVCSDGLWCMYRTMNNFQPTSEILKFMLECGMKPKKEDHWGRSALLDVCAKAVFGMQDLPLISNLIELRGPLQLYPGRYIFSNPPYYDNLKHNLGLILSHDEELIQAPKIAKAIIQESEEQLREALARGHASPNDRIGNTWPLELALGWPKGIQILLQSGANPHWHFPLLAKGKGEKYQTSAAILFEAGCVIRIEDLVYSKQNYDGIYDDGRRYPLLISELAARRRRLCMLAEYSLPPDQMPPLDGPPANISRALVGHGIDVPIALRVATDSVGSIATYQTWLADPSIDFVKIMDNIYELGFHEVDVPDHNGQTPLMMFYPPRISEDTPVVIKSAAWLVSKGASVDRKLPRSNANAAHLLTAQVINCHFRGVLHQSDSSDYRNWKKGVAELGDACFFIPPSQDGCICACSPGGCTTLSVALRAIIFMISKWQLKIQDDCLRILICSLVVWQDSWPDLLRAIVRALTFDALGLTHTCCTEIDQVEENFPPDVFLNKGRDETEISRILDDQRLLVKEFEELTEEMESKLDELGLPLEEFLDGYWYDRVIEYLLRRDHYDEEHVTEARKMGIFLEPEEFCIPDRVSLQFRPRLQHLQDNSSQEDRQ